jgi:hypothetical protein
MKRKQGDVSVSPVLDSHLGLPLSDVRAFTVVQVGWPLLVSEVTLGL